MLRRLIRSRAHREGGFSASPAPRAGLALALLLGFLATSACYRYAPLLGEPPAPGAEVRVRLSGGAASELSDRVGQPVRSLEGAVLASSPDSLVLDVGWGALYAGTMFEGRRDTLTFRSDQVLEVDERAFSAVRTTGVAVALAAVILAIFRTMAGGGGGSGGDGTGGTPTF